MIELTEYVPIESIKTLLTAVQWDDSKSITDNGTVKLSQRSQVVEEKNVHSPKKTKF